MNPKEFNWTEDQQVTVTNPTSEDFRFKVHAKEYVIKAGTTAKMPGYIAWMYAYHLASKMAQKEGKYIHWNEEGFRQRYYDKIVIGADSLVETITPEPQIEQMDDELDDELLSELEDDEPPKGGQTEGQQDKLPPAETAKIKPMKPAKKNGGRRKKTQANSK